MVSVWASGSPPPVVLETLRTPSAVMGAVLNHIERHLLIFTNLPDCADPRDEFEALKGSLARTFGAICNPALVAKVNHRRFIRVFLTLLRRFVRRREAISLLLLGSRCKHKDDETTIHSTRRDLRGRVEGDIIDDTWQILLRYFDKAGTYDSFARACLKGIMLYFMRSESGNILPASGAPYHHILRSYTPSSPDLSSSRILSLQSLPWRRG
ncbi:hypothetical protein HGRIS_013552 [Hohenbuehelia grisea]|uniref:Uncharacterized protein n=1 Tax=Hohenbuehelia grisea TaxID=104357 RepID=A0ABR3IW44_9AGAR